MSEPVASAEEERSFAPGGFETPQVALIAVADVLE
jgi:hypothetical protein